MKLREINKKEFFDFCKSQSTNNFYQTKEYAEFSRLKGYHTYFLGVDQNGKIKAATLLLSKKIKFTKSKIFFAPRGYIMNFKDLELLRFLTKEIKNFIEEKKGVFLRINPYYPIKQVDLDGNYVTGGFNNEKVLNILQELGYKKSPNKMTSPKFYHQVLLKDKNEQELFNNCHEEHKNIILNNTEKGLITKEITDNQLNDTINLIKQSHYKINFIDNLSNFKEFYKIMNESNMIKINIVEMNIDKYKENLLNEIERTGTENKELDLVKKLEYQYGHSVIMGCNVTIYYGNEATTICTAINDKFVEYFPIYTLFWNSIKDAKNNGVEKYNFYGFNSDSIDNNKWDSLYRGFNSELIELIDEHDLINNEFIYNQYCKYLNRHKQNILGFK